MEICPVCRANLNNAGSCRRCRTDLQRVQEVERLGERLTAMLSLAEGEMTAARLIRCRKTRTKT